MDGRGWRGNGLNWLMIVSNNKLRVLAHLYFLVLLVEVDLYAVYDLSVYAACFILVAGHSYKRLFFRSIK